MRKRTGYLFRRGEVYYACWFVGHKKFVRTTGQTDRKKATAELNRLMEPFAVGDEITVLQNVKAKIEGRTAELAQIEDERNPPLTLVKAWSAYAESPDRPDSGKGSMKNYEGHWFGFLKWIQTNHPEVIAMRDVTAAIGKEYAAGLTARNVSPNTYNKHLVFLTSFFKVLAEPARITANPWVTIRRKNGVANSRRELTTAELKAVCAAAAGEMRLLFGLGIYTGLRRGDCATLRWNEVDLARRIIRRIPNKTKRKNPKPVLVPIHAVLHGMLGQIEHKGRSEFVLPQTAEIYQRKPEALTKQVQDHFEACGVQTHAPGTGFAVVTGPDGKTSEQHTGKRAVVQVGFHSLRHTFVSLCRAADAPLSVVESIVGHSNPSMTRHYTHTGAEAAAMAVNGLPSVMGGDVPALPPADPVAVLKAAVRAAADRLGPDTWESVKTELAQLTDNERTTTK